MFTDTELNSFLASDLDVRAASYQFNTVNVIFDNDFRIAVDGVETSAPAAYLKTSDKNTLDMKRGEEITINSEVYKIGSIQDDGAGITTLVLTKED